jgi:phospholipid/cholesterol/gamma-HCH transport system ATP-binding protein
VTTDATVPIFELRGVTKRFDDHPVLAGVDLALRRGETVSLIGPSGCGKTVLLKCMIGLLPIDGGEILFDGVALGSMGEAERLDLRRRVGLMFQYNALFDSMTVAENVAYGLHERLVHPMSEKDIAERVSWALACVGMPGTERLRPDEMSGGMRKRVGLARTMALRPEVILYDEPTMGLDPINTHRIADLIEGLHSSYGISALMVTHDMKLAKHVSDRMVMMFEGRVIGEGTPDAMTEHPDARVRDFITGTDRSDPG